MSPNGACTSGHSPLIAAARALARLGCGALTLMLALVVIAPVSALASERTRYSLSITEGVSTIPEDGIQSTSAGINPSSRQLVRISIIHNGAVVAQAKGQGGAWMSQVPQVGDVVTLESPLGATLAAVAYDGLPSMDATVCAGSSNFSGQRTPGETVEGEYWTIASPYVWDHKNVGQAQITLLAGSSFGGNFLAPLGLGETVAADEKVETPLAGGALFAYSSETVRPVGACPVPPPPPPPPPPPIILQGKILHLTATTIGNLLKHGWSDLVGLSEGGTVTQDLYLEDGTMPAYAARSHRHRPPAQLLAKGSASSRTAGKVTVVLHVSPRARGRLRAAKSLHVVLITTIRSSSGTRLNLPRRQFVLHR